MNENTKRVDNNEKNWCSNNNLFFLQDLSLWQSFFFHNSHKLKLFFVKNIVFLTYNTRKKWDQRSETEETRPKKQDRKSETEKARPFFCIRKIKKKPNRLRLDWDLPHDLWNELHVIFY